MRSPGGSWGVISRLSFSFMALTMATVFEPVTLTIPRLTQGWSL